jgi:hypothetical protein
MSVQKKKKKLCHLNREAAGFIQISNGTASVFGYVQFRHHNQKPNVMTQGNICDHEHTRTT